MNVFISEEVGIPVVTNETKLRNEAYNKLFGKPKETAEPGNWITNYSMAVLAILICLFFI